MNLIQACKRELEKHWEVQIAHIYKESNRTASLLASGSLYHDRGVT